MSYRFDPQRQYLMPTHFGPMAGPRHSPSGTRFPDPDNRIKETYTVSFLTEPDVLSALLPEGFALEGEPIVSVTFSYMQNIEWLAGRGYNMLGVTIPARIRAGGRSIAGPFLLVLWENLADPIITGREQLGFNKIYCELPEFSTSAGGVTCRAAWLGHQFCLMYLRDLNERPNPVRYASAVGEDTAERANLLHLRYFPSVGRLSEAAICEPVISPLSSASGVTEAVLFGAGKVDFLKTRWEDMPTQYHIVERLRALPVIETRGAEYRKIKGGGDHFAQESVG
ncbi:acetoacetate decarboxylase family protein [soil metagenome]